MKKSGPKKVSHSLKTASGKQQKISNFFIPNATGSSVSAGKQDNEEIVVEVEDQHFNNQPSERLPVDNICSQCLKRSPIQNSGYCSQCNIVENKHQLGEKPSTVTNSLLQHNQNNCAPKTQVLSSPDIIPATPPIKSKPRKNLKTAKRKCSFGDEIRIKKKLPTSLIEQKNLVTSKQNSITKNGSSKENTFVVSQKSNIENTKSRNPFCKTSLIKNIPDSDHIIETLLKEDIAKNEIRAVLLHTDPPKRTSHHCEYKIATTDQNSTLKQSFKDTATVKENGKMSPSEHNLITEPLNYNIIGEVFPNAKNPVKIENRTNIVDKNELTDEADISFSLYKKDAFKSNMSACVNEHLNDAAKLSSVELSKSAANSVENKDNIASISSLENVLDNLFDDSALFEDVFKEPLRLDSSTRCKVMSIDHLKMSGEVVLALTSCDADETETDSVTCVLRGSWANSSVSVGDIVSVRARPVTGQEGCWVVDNEGGLLVAQPDTLVSGTTVVGSLFCMRRSVLSDMYRGIDSDSSIMVIGSFLHQLLQEVLKKKVSTLDGIDKVLQEFMKTHYFVFNLYSSGLLLEKTVETLKEFIPKIHAFVQKYLCSESLNSRVKNWNEENSWNGTITDIADIEENIWSPNLGLKGKIDVTVKTSAKNYKDKVMPLELKTGRASFSAEHRGQVILYTMMMSELGKTVDSGLLLYLREGIMKEVPVGAVERRDLMLLRNELVTQLKASQSVTVNKDHKIIAPALPPPINHHSACGKCPYLSLCSAALRVNGCDELSEKHPLRELSQSSTDHLQMHHIVYVFHWTGLLRLEHNEALLNSPSLHHIWTMPPALRAKRGTCISQVKLVDQVEEVVAGSYRHVFHSDSGVTGGLTEGDYVVVSSVSRPAIAAGPLTHISQSRFTLQLERDLSVHQGVENVWYLDKYESQSGLVFNMTNLGCLLDNTEQAGRLRKAVIDMDLPEFRPKLSSRVLKASVDLLSQLNEQQRKAVFRALAANQYILIKGMPGTGKTATIVALVQLAVRLGQSVLITSHTHSAVDNVLLRLKGKVDFLRLGSAHKLHPELAQYGEAGCHFDSPEELHSFYNSKKVVGVTCLGSSHALLTKRQFDLCIVDEATQVLQPTVLRPLFSAHKFILIGDPNQLPPLVRSSKAKELGLGESLFARLDRPAVTTELSLQYRMNQTVTDLANILTYGGKLQCGTRQVASATLTPPPTVHDEDLAWVRAALSPVLADAVVVIDTGVCEAVACVNTKEADIVQSLLTVLAKSLSDERVGVIAPYRAQVEYLRQRAKSLSSLVEVNTVDQYQGRDKDVIIYSCTRSAKPTDSDILGDKNRLTVAITRARHKLIIVGNVRLLRGYSVFDQLFNSIPSSCIIPIS